MGQYLDVLERYVSNIFKLITLSVYFQNKSNVETVKTCRSVAIQCQFGTDLDSIGLLGDSNPKLDVILGNGDIYPEAEEFKTSLNKLDTLINTLNEIQSLYTNKTSKLILESRNDVGDSENNRNILNFQENEKFLNLYSRTEVVNNLSKEEILKFNINFDENTFIQCHTNRGKHSLEIIQNSGQKSYNPLIVHRCESELLLSKSIDPICKSELKNMKSSSEMCCQLQGRYQTLSIGSIFNVSSFKKNLVEHMTNIKEDVKTLRNILYGIECFVKKEDIPALPTYFDEIKKWFSGRESEIVYNIRGDNLSRDLMRVEASRYVEAKIRATNFCKFYTLTKFSKAKSKQRKYKKN